MTRPFPTYDEGKNGTPVSKYTSELENAGEIPLPPLRESAVCILSLSFRESIESGRPVLMDWAYTLKTLIWSRAQTLPRI